jgi:hypothetical protein
MLATGPALRRHNTRKRESDGRREEDKAGERGRKNWKTIKKLKNIL